jgi:hypothetical protein
MQRYRHYQIWERALEDPSVEFIGYLVENNFGESLFEDQDGNTYYVYDPHVLEESECFTALCTESWWDSTGHGKGCAGVIENMRVSGWLQDGIPIPLILLPPVEFEGMHTIQDYDA